MKEKGKEMKKGKGEKYFLIQCTKDETPRCDFKI